MRVKTDQPISFADQFITVPDSELETLNSLLNWASFTEHFQSIQGDYSSISLFKMLLLQTWFNMSDEVVSNAVCRDIVFMRFCGFSLEGNKPNASTLCRFRARLVASGQLASLLDRINGQLSEQGLKLANGKYVSCDATLISSARRPRKKLEGEQVDEDCYQANRFEYSDDTDASWKNKGSQSVYGYAGFVSTDEDGFVDAVSTRTAADSEVRHFPEVMKNAHIMEGKTLLYDKGADSAANREALRKLGLHDGIMRKKPKGKPMTFWNKLRNKLISSKRFVTERTFGTIKRTYGMSRARYLGLEKVNAELLLKSIAYNMKRAKTVLKKQSLISQSSCV